MRDSEADPIACSLNAGLLLIPYRHHNRWGSATGRAAPSIPQHLDPSTACSDGYATGNTRPLPRETECNFTAASYRVVSHKMGFESNVDRSIKNGTDFIAMGTKVREGTTILDQFCFYIGRDGGWGGGDLCNSVKCWTTTAHQAAVLLPGSLSCFSLSSPSLTPGAWRSTTQPPTHTGIN